LSATTGQHNAHELPLLLTDKKNGERKYVGR